MKAKQRKKMYVSALEYNLERLYCEAAALSARLNLWMVNQHHWHPSKEKLSMQ